MLPEVKLSRTERVEKLMFEPMYLELIENRPEVKESQLPDRGDPLPNMNEPLIHDLRESLPRHPQKRWSRRSLEHIRFIILHQTLTDFRRTTFHGIAMYSTTPSPENHLSASGAPAVPYHYGICSKGDIFLMNDWEDVTWSVRGHNTDSLNIALLGDFDGRGHKGINDPTASQLQVLDALLQKLVHDPALVNFEGIRFHSDFGKPACPGNEIEKWLKNHSIYSLYHI